MKNKILSILIAFFAVLVCLCYGGPLLNYVHNYYLDYEHYVYLGGENIVIDYKTSSEPSAAAADNEYATIGTITYINKNRTYGAVAHKISNHKIKSGNIYITPVNGVIKSSKTRIGEKNVIIGYNDSNGNISTINDTGIYGTYNYDFTNKPLMKIAMPSEIEKSEAYIYTVVDGEKIEAYKIEIIKVFYGRKSHNIYFRIVDEKLLNATGGVIKGMSGSPIVQNGKIIGAISHVEDNDPTCGYGLFITYMI